MEFAEVGTNSVVRRKTLFESAELADWLRNFLFHLNGPGLRGANPAAQIFSVFGRCYLNTRGGGWKPPFHGLRANKLLIIECFGIVTLHVRGEAGSLLSMGYARQITDYRVLWYSYLTRAGGGWKPTFHGVRESRGRRTGGSFREIFLGR